MNEENLSSMSGKQNSKKCPSVALLNDQNSSIQVSNTVLSKSKVIYQYNGQPRNSLDFKRIKNGIIAAPFSRPWMGRLYKANQLDISPTGVCGAFLISRQPNHLSHMDYGSSDIVLTAAHCIPGNTKDYYVSFGRHNVSAEHEPNKLDVYVEHALIHRQYCHRSSFKECASNDIAMLKLKEPVVFNKFIKPLALSNSSSLLNCSMSGWGNPVELDNLLRTILLNDTTDRGFYVEGVTIDGAHIVNGDSGSPIVCLMNEQYVVRGIVSRSGDGMGWFADTVDNMQWIIDAYNEIDSPSMLYHPDLAPYARSRSYRSEEVQPLLHWLSNYIIEKNLEIMPEEPLDYVSQWHRWRIYSRFIIGKDQFCPDNIFGYTTVDNVYHCAVYCYLRSLTSKKLMCSYLSTFKRCYLSFTTDDKMCHLMPASHSVVFSRKPVDYYEPHTMLSANNNNSRTKKHLRTQQSWKKWEVHATVAERPNFHCLGFFMPSMDYNAYETVEFSTKCLKSLRRAIPPDAKINVVARFENALVDVDIHNEFREIGNNMTIQTSKITPISVPAGVSCIYGHHNDLNFEPEDNLEAIMYSPYSGAFRSKPKELPFILRFDIAHNDKCMGVLIDIKPLMSHMLKQNQLEFALTSGNCANRMLHRPVIGAGRAYFLNERKWKYNQMKVKSVHIHPAYLDSMSHQPQSRTVHNIAIIVMRLKVKASTRIAQPIQFPLHPVPLDSNFLIATWNVSGGDTRLPLYEVPVEINRAAIESAKNPKKLLTRRLHLIGDDKFDNELVGRPLLAYNEQSENFTLAGFYSGTIGKRSNEQVEIHVTVYPHIQWIRETLTSLLTTKKDKKNRSINKL